MVYFLTYYYNATGCIPPPLRKEEITEGTIWNCAYAWLTSAV
jgi:hypothetical protein